METDTTARTGTTARERPRGRAIIAMAAAVALVLVGAAGGMLLTKARLEPPAPPGPGSVDVGFAQDMSVHHLQAVTMAGWARDRSTDTEVRTLAVDIESTQQTQVGMMRGWLTLWNQPPLPEPGNLMAWMSDTTDHGEMSGNTSMTSDDARIMPGMATTAELTRLRGMSGPEFDVYFLQLMQRHHEGGAPMARNAAGRAAQTAVRALANSIAVSQTAEVDTIKAMLAKRGAQPLR